MKGNPSSHEPPIALDEKQLLDRIRQAIDCFDNIFAQIAPCQPRKGTSTRDDATEQIIAAKILNDHQKMAIAQLSGHLMSLHDLVYNVTLQRIHQSSELSHLPMHLPTRCEEEQAVEVSPTPTEGASSSDDANKKMLVEMQKLRLLQEYLVNELLHSEQLEDKLKKAEYNLLKVTDERDNLAKRLAKANSNTNNSNSNNNNSHGNQKNSKPSNAKFTPAKSSSSVTLAQSTTNKSPKFENTPVGSAIKKEKAGKDESVSSNLAGSADSLVGRFIRKTFDGRKYFGLVISFKSPYFMVVYEDGDNEELKRNEVIQVLWYETVPTSRVASCERHKKRLLAQLNDGDEVEHIPTDSSPTTICSSTPSIKSSKRPRTSDSDECLPFGLRGDEIISGEENPSNRFSSRCTSAGFGGPKGFFFEDVEETKLKQAIVNELLGGVLSSK